MIAPALENQRMSEKSSLEYSAQFLGLPRAITTYSLSNGSTMLLKSQNSEFVIILVKGARKPNPSYLGINICVHLLQFTLGGNSDRRVTIPAEFVDLQKNVWLIQRQKMFKIAIY